MATKQQNNDDFQHPVGTALNADIVPVKQPRLGDLVKVKGNQDATPRMDEQSFFPTDKPVEVKVTTRVIKLLRDGDLILV